jgi:hypothetical protein
MEHVEALLFVAIMEHVLLFIAMLEAEIIMEAEFLRTSIGDLSLCGR